MITIDAQQENLLQFANDARDLSGYIYTPNGQIPDGWTKLKDSDFYQLGDKGFYAEAYQKGDTVMISIRGTQLNDPQDLINDVQMAEGKVPQQLNDLKAFYENLVNNPTLNLAGKQVIFTGNSAGGSLAEAGAALWNGKALTYNSYGVQPWIHNAAQQYGISDVSSNPADYTDKIINYNTQTDLVGNAGTHLGGNLYIPGPSDVWQTLSGLPTNSVTALIDAYYHVYDGHLPYNFNGYNLSNPLADSRITDVPSDIAKLFNNVGEGIRTIAQRYNTSDFGISFQGTQANPQISYNLSKNAIKPVDYSPLMENVQTSASGEIISKGDYPIPSSVYVPPSSGSAPSSTQYIYTSKPGGGGIWGAILGFAGAVGGAILVAINPTFAVTTVSATLSNPLSLDLDGDGIETLDIDNTSLHFDTNNDSTFKERTGWLKGDDALLARDLNGNGVIDNQSELFGSSSTKGFADLKLLDSNNDNKIDSNDTAFSSLKIWQDVNENAITDAGELKTLSEVGIKSISLSYSSINQTQNDNVISEKAIFTKNDGSQGYAYDVNFATNPIYTEYTGDYNLDIDTLNLPWIRGFGKVADLQLVSSQNDSLKTLVSELSQITDSYELYNRMDELLAKWAGIDSIPANQMSGSVNTRTLKVLSQFLNCPFTDNVTQDQKVYVEEAYKELKAKIYVDFLAQTSIGSSFNITYDYNTDAIFYNNATYSNLISNLTNDKNFYASYLITKVLADSFALDMNKLTTQILKQGYGSALVSYLNGGLQEKSTGGYTYTNPSIPLYIIDSNNGSSSTGSNYADVIYGRDGNDILNGGAGNDFLDGGAGNDIIYGGDGNDVINGGKGNDSLFGGYGNDTYIFEGDGGQDVIDDSCWVTVQQQQWYKTGGFLGLFQHWADRWVTTTQQVDAGNDTVVFGKGISLSNLSFDRSGYDLILKLNDTANKLTIRNWYSSDKSKVENFVFDDGAVINSSHINGMSFGTTGNDLINKDDNDNMLFASDGNDTINTYKGNDVIDAGAGNDIINAGDGNDYINSSAGNDSVSAGAGNDIIYDYQGNDTLSGDAGIDFITDYQGNDVIHGGDDTDFISDYDGNDKLYGDAGDDIINSYNAGDDTITGGTGNDVINDYQGNDVYYFNVGDGQDQIYDASGTDKIIFGPGITQSNLNFIKSDGDLEIDFLNSTDKITFKYWFGDHKIETLQFADGSTLSPSVIESNLSSRFIGTDLADTITGDDLNSYIQGNAGNDTIYDYKGSDLISGGLGNDIIEDYDGDDIINGDDGNDLIKSFNAGNDNINGGAGDDTIHDYQGNDILSGGAGNDLIYDYSGNDKLYGNDGNDQLYSYNDGDDILDGGAGADTMQGCLGNDTYYVDNTGDQVWENLNEGTDSVISSIDYTLWSNIENLTLTGTADLRGEGNSLDNIITGNDGNNFIVDYTGNDTIHGGAGNDSIEDYSGNDLLFGDAGNDTIKSFNAGDDTILGGDGNDVIYDYQGNDILSGCAGDDIIYDFGGNNELYGNEGNDSLFAYNDGDDIINGGTGADLMQGCLGNDTYYVDNTGDQIWENLNEGTDEVRSTISYTLWNNIENLTLLGINSINAYGNSLNNLIVGNFGDNILYGDVGADTMIGRTGNDTYFVDNTADIITENLNEGTDIVNSAVNYTLSANVENLNLSGAAINGTGNSLNNQIIGNSLNNILDGGIGADTLIGGIGNDTYLVDNTGDQVWENLNEGTDLVISNVNYTLLNNVENLTLTGSAINGTGNSLNNQIIGNSLNNIIDGGIGNDTLIGGIGNDTYFVDNTADIITENLNEGTDIVNSAVNYTLSANVENLNLSGTAINGTGNSLNNQIIGNSLNNILDGGIGADTLIGGIGNDTYLVDNTGDQVWENLNEGTDLVISNVNYTLLNNVENLTLTGSAINGTGNSLNNQIIGNSLNNIIDGGIGNDTLIGGIGNDTYFVDNTADIITENLNEGTDIVNSAVNYTLSANVENLNLSGAAINGTGNSLNNQIIGNSLNNILDGGIGADTLIGGIGNDTLLGGDGDDTYIFNTGDGQDTINDTSGNDTVKFNSGITESSVAIFQQGNDILLSYDNNGDTVTIKNQSTTGTIEKVQLSDGKYLTSADMNVVLQNMSSFISSNNIQLTGISDVKNNQQLMNLISNSWHN